MTEARTKRVCFSKRQNATDHFGISLLCFFGRQRLPAPAEFGTGMKGRRRDSQMLLAVLRSPQPVPILLGAV